MFDRSPHITSPHIATRSTRTLEVTSNAYGTIHTLHSAASCEDRNSSKCIPTCAEHLYETIGWPLARRYGHAYDALKEAVNAPEEVLGQLEMDEKVKECLLRNIQMRLKPQPVRLRADVEITCFKPAGIDGSGDFVCVCVCGGGGLCVCVGLRLYLCLCLYVTMCMYVCVYMSFHGRCAT